MNEAAVTFISDHAKWVYTDAETAMTRINDRIDKLLVFNSTSLGLAFAGVRLVRPKTQSESFVALRRLASPG